MEQERLFDWLRLGRVYGLGPVLGGRLLEQYQTPAAVFAADPRELRRVEGVGEALAAALRDPRASELAGQDLEACAKAGISVLPLADPAYPAPLREIADPPLLLFMRGSWTGEDEGGVAVVGCRNPDPYGESMATALGAGLARYRVTVISGMARGVDGLAQKAALQAGGRSVAVLGTGPDVIYPPEHAALYAELCERGAVLSEFPPGTGPEPSNFPRRNRVISGLSRGVLLVQARSSKSGALITVRHAREQGREVYAVPGNAGSAMGRAGNDLIKQGARLVESAEDVVLDQRPLGTVPLAEQKKPELRLPDGQSRLYALIPTPAEGSIDVDALARQSGLSPAEAGGSLLELELMGLVRQLPGNRYVRLDR